VFLFELGFPLHQLNYLGLFPLLVQHLFVGFQVFDESPFVLVLVACLDVKFNFLPESLFGLSDHL
jgi:hypothetical protein